MACFIATFGLILLLGLSDLSAGNSDTCTIYAAVGESTTLPFDFKGLDKTHSLRWTHNKTIIFNRQKGKVSTGKPDDITATGSILLKNIKFSSTGIYEVSILHSNVTLAKSWTGHLCVMDKASMPQLSYVCDYNAVNLKCHVAKHQGLVFSWTLNNKTLLSETRQTLSISLSQLKEERNFSCSVANKVSVESSETVRPTCKAHLLCFKPQTVMAVKVGGAGLIFLLLVSVVALCCCLRCNKTQMNFRDKGELKMHSIKKQEAEFVNPEYETIDLVVPIHPLCPLFGAGLQGSWCLSPAVTVPEVEYTPDRSQVHHRDT
uniref:Ig-like domain-containing protein n=1 Tax=Kryptolebias marmoratus TaxID=37003 RepID=A0A3Q3AA23_KRYMA